MLILVRVDQAEPPVGEVAVEGAAPVPFSGWLELIRALSEVIEARPPEPPPDPPAP